MSDKTLLSLQELICLRTSHVVTRGDLRSLVASFEWLAPPPSDDDEPISREWFESEYGPGAYWITRLVTLSVIPNGLVSIATNCDCCSGEVHRWLEGVKTRRQLRDLLAALGYRPIDDR